MFEKSGLPQGGHSIEFKNNKKEYLFLFGVDTDGPLKPFVPVDPVEPNHR